MSTPMLVSIQVGMPAVHDAETKKAWESGIFKFPVSQPIWLGALNLVGDGQQDLRVHGGPFRSVLGYAESHYPEWRRRMNRPDLPYGAFGENFTISEVTEQTVCLGDVYQVGDAQIQVTQPRQPCWKLARRWNARLLTAQVHKTGRGGWYYRTVREGYVEAGQPIVLLERPYPEYTIAFVNELMKGEDFDPFAYRALASIDALSPGWRAEFESRAIGQE